MNLIMTITATAVTTFILGIVIGILLFRQYTKEKIKSLQSQLDLLVSETHTLSELKIETVRLQTQLESKIDETQQQTKRLSELEQRNLSLQTQYTQTREQLRQEQKNAEEKTLLIEEAKTQLIDAFKATSADALRSNNESFLQLAQESFQKLQTAAHGDLEKRQQAIDQLTKPIHERLVKFDGKLDELERNRIHAYQALDTQIQTLLETHLPRLHQETANLVKALRQPQTRGRWGEIQLKRVVEMAGMLQYCDFDEQVHLRTEHGVLRPDLIVHLPGHRQVVVDAKTPLDAYLNAIETSDEDLQQQAFRQHARQLRDHITQLGKKAYFEQFDPSPEFVILFIPGEAFFAAALSQDPSLIEYGTQKQVIPASPTTLIALLKAISYGWQQESLTQNAQEIAQIGKELYERLQNMSHHWQHLGKNLQQTVEAYNRAVGSLEARVLPSARKFRELQQITTRQEIPVLNPLSIEPRPLTSPEFGTENDSD